MASSANCATETIQHAERFDERALESFLLSLSEGELLILENLMSARRVRTRAPDMEQFTETEVQNFQSLTARENQVLTLVARGYTRPEVADVLAISRNTAATHIASVYRKLDVRSIAEATMNAYRWGLVG